MREVAADFGVSETCLQNWLRRADAAERTRSGTSVTEVGESRELKRRVRLLEQENEVLRKVAAYRRRRTCAWVAPQNDLPARP